MNMELFIELLEVAYKRGFDNGYDVGYVKGYADGAKDMEDLTAEAEPSDEDLDKELSADLDAEFQHSLGEYLRVLNGPEIEVRGPVFNAHPEGDEWTNGIYHYGRPEGGIDHDGSVQKPPGRS